MGGEGGYIDVEMWAQTWMKLRGRRETLVTQRKSGVKESWEEKSTGKMKRRKGMGLWRTDAIFLLLYPLLQPLLLLFCTSCSISFLPLTLPLQPFYSSRSIHPSIFRVILSPTRFTLLILRADCYGAVTVLNERFFVVKYWYFKIGLAFPVDHFLSSNLSQSLWCIK